MLRSWSWTLPRYRGSNQEISLSVSKTSVPVFTLYEQADRDGRTRDLLQELEEVLGIASYPNELANRDGESFEGLYDLL